MRTLIELIRREIAATGVLSFARFMELVLYCPNYGYYQTKRDNPGRRGDYFTSVSVGELFGQLLAFQFAGWLEEIKSLNPQPSTLSLIEAGAHDGTLGRDILSWLQMARPKLLKQIEYGIIEPSLLRQKWQNEKLEKFAPHVRWFTDFKTLLHVTRHWSLRGVIFSNELLDAMPMHRFGWDAAAKKWFEWGVALEGKKFVWARMTGSCHLPLVTRHVPPELLAVLPDGYTVEVSPAAETWWREAAGALEHGRLMTIDYGLTTDELFSPSRPNGTMRAYFRHHLADDILANVGEQDITAHVDFPAIQAAGEAAGLATECFSTQSQFLTRILEKATKHNFFHDWNASRSRQFQTLSHPEHLGQRFRVLVQCRTLSAVHN